MSILTEPIHLPHLSRPRLKKPGLSKPGLSKPGLSAPRRRSAAVTGLEIGAFQAVAAEARCIDGRIAVTRAAARDLPEGLVRDGLVIDIEGLAGELRHLFADHRLGKRVRLGLATPRTILRNIDLPPLDERDIRAALMMQAQDRIPMPLDRAVLDYQTVGLVDTPEGRRLRVVVVATEREGVEDMLEVLRRAGLRAEGIDLSIFAAIRAVAGPEPSEGPTLYAQLGDLVNVAIADHGICHFTRQAPQGLALVLGRLAETRDCTLQEARALLDVAAGVAPGEVSSADVTQVGALLSRVAGELGSELRAAAEFYGGQFGAAVTEGIVTGPLTPLRGFVDALEETSGLSLRCGEAAAANADAPTEVDLRVLPVAAGLTVERVRP